MSTERLCLYCGEPTGRVGKGDHLIPAAIGGTLATKDVCNNCNNDLSDIDRELCSRSPLSLAACRVFDGHIAQAWDVDAAERNLLIDGRLDSEQGFRIFPQMVVMPTTEQYRADWPEIREFGFDKFEVLFKRRLRKAFCQFRSGSKKAIRFSEVPYNSDLLTRYSHFPRFLVRGTVAQACSTKTIELSYSSRAMKRMALARLDDGLNINHQSRTEVRTGSDLPAIRFFCDGGKVWRGLAKIAINLLHYYCRSTEVSSRTFSRVIQEIRGKRKFDPIRLRRSGFVCHYDVASIAVDASHSVRLSWSDGFWNATMAFFGGMIGAAVKFPGPNKETWRMLDITAPLRSSDWRVSPSSLVIPSRFSVEWGDLNKMIAGGGFVAMKSDMFED
jgi:hypothetical protein